MRVSCNCAAVHLLWLLSACAGSQPGALEPAPRNETSTGASRSGSGPLKTPIQHTTETIVYQSGPPSMPHVEMAVLEGNPQKAGMFTIRLKAPPGFALPPHTHPAEERVTVLSGSISVGFGESVARDQARTFPAGSFYINPRNVPHFVFSDEGAMVQITGDGPWRVDVLPAR